MKHIKKKFCHEVHLSEQDKITMEKDGKLIPSTESKNIRKINKDEKCLLITDGNKGIESFHVNIDGRNFLIPEPDPILIYFNNAYNNYRHIKEARKEMLNALNGESISENVTNQLYSYFGLCNGFVIFLYTAMEAFINRHLPQNFIYVVETNRCDEVYNNEQIQRMNTDTKIKKVFTAATGKDFEKSYPLKYQHINNLKDFRDSIVHTKTNKDGSTRYEYLFKKALNFKYEETLHAVRDYLNYYQPDYIEECGCGLDF